MRRLEGKVIIVTGAARGIGRACAQACARAGARVVVNYLSREDAAREVVAAIEHDGGVAVAVQGDVSRSTDADRLVRRTIDVFGGLTGLVNNAGVAPFVDILSAGEELWERTMAVNAKGPFLMTQAAAKAMIHLGSRGRICNITSISGVKATNPRQVPYCASKGAANMLTKASAIALAPYGITVNAILPGTIETDLNREILAEELVRQGIVDATPMKRLGSGEDVAAAVVYLMSDESSWVTGTLLPVDGGFIA